MTINAEKVYLDTSAYLAMLLGEDSGAKLKRYIKGKLLCTSTVLLIESERNIVRLCRAGHLASSAYQKVLRRIEEDKEFFIFRDFTPDLALTGSFPAVLTPRSRDLIHIRTAQWFMLHTNLTGFVSLDQKQCESAEELGLPVVRKDWEGN